eukprot:CAMPEP_0203667942 /NCGR_PEP_ID=MMETSP0090-20130426/4667_1 /ASSEMBLY_ACC=CAM_ASM_001088 /TAXON_ID=426623 /ORGANISM="Chaetoceros affinis, Strain CCMP159" /LENGTH=585 /DNA_ID=CAMNT_0050532235 /DNA_START=176 /DNA_END=1933 /DNA_ORIENTATION=-
MKLLPASTCIMAALSQLLFLSPEQTIASASTSAKVSSSSTSSQRALGASSPWTQLGTPISIGTPSTDNLLSPSSLIGLGFSIASSSNGKIVAVGSPYANNNAGRVGVYQYDDTLQLWVLRGREMNGFSHGYHYGYDVALSHSGTVLVVAAPRALGGRGFVAVYRFDAYADEWEKIGGDIEGKFMSEEFGTSVAVSEDGNLIVVGAPRASSRPGAVRVYEFTGAEDDVAANGGGGADGGGKTWEQVGEDILGESDNDRAGHSVDILTHKPTRSTYVAVGALMDLYTEGSVAVYKYDTIQSKWDQFGSRVDGDEFGTEFGRSVSLGHDGTDLILAVGFPGPGMDENSKVKSGAQVYNINVDGIWDFYGQMIFPLEEDDNTGYKVSLSSDGQTLAVSSPNYGPVGQGLVHVYYKGNSDVYKRVGHGIMGSENDELGYALSVSRDGKIVTASTPDAQYVATFVIGSDIDLTHLSPNSMSAMAIASLTFFIVCSIALLSFGTFKAVVYVRNRRTTRFFSSVPRSNNEYEISQVSALPRTPRNGTHDHAYAHADTHVIGELESDDEDGSEVSYDEEDNYESHLRRVTPDII